MNRQQHTATALAAFLTGTLAAGVGNAQDASECSGSMIHHHWSAPQDYGRGLTIQESGHQGYHGAGPWGGTQVAIVECATGRILTISRSETDDTARLVFNHSRRVDRVLRAGLKERDISAFDYLAGRAARMRLKNSSETLGVETCGCAAYYPEMRGDKTAYEATQ